jgi:hypothetical protein
MRLAVYFTAAEFRREYAGPEYRDVLELMDYLETKLPRG